METDRFRRMFRKKPAASVDFRHPQPISDTFAPLPLPQAPTGGDQLSQPLRVVQQGGTRRFAAKWKRAREWEVPLNTYTATYPDQPFLLLLLEGVPP